MKGLDKEKLEYTKDLIHCWYESWDGQIYVAFSGGKDSTVLLHIVRSLYPKVKAVFSNTGLEFPEIVKFVKTFDNVEIIRPKLPFHKVVKKYGWPVISKSVSMAVSRYRNTKRQDQKEYRLYGKVVNGKKYTAGVIPAKYHYLIDAPFKIGNQCCEHLKKKPFHIFEKRTGLKPLIGLMASDSNTRLMDLQRRGCNSYEVKNPQGRPLAKWTEEDVYAYGEEHKLKICDVYKQGYPRTGCVFCMYGLAQEKKRFGENRFERMRVTHPKLYDYCINKLGAKEVLDFMKFPY